MAGTPCTLRSGSALLAPASCAMFRELGESLLSLQRAMQAPPLLQEAALLQRLLYKNKNQHRTTLHYRRLAEAARRLRAVLPVDGTGQAARQPPVCVLMDEFVGALMGGLPPSSTPSIAGDSGALRGLARTMPKPIRLPCRADARKLLALLIASEEHAEVLSTALLRAYRMMRLLLSQTNFMPFCTTMLAVTARLHTLLGELPQQRARCVDCLAACESQLPDADGDSTSTASASEQSSDEDEQVHSNLAKPDGWRDGRGGQSDSSAAQQHCEGTVVQQPLLSTASKQITAENIGDSSDDEEQDHDDWGELLDSDDESDVQAQQFTSTALSAELAADVAADESSDAELDSASLSDGEGGSDGVHVLASVSLRHGARLCVSAGSVLDFGEGGTGWPRARTAVVNAANTGGLGGGGVDGAFVSRGGARLAGDRQALPILSTGGGAEERIRTGGAAVTGPNRYGSLFANTVIHAVGPAYGYTSNEFSQGDALLASAYIAAMRCASGVRTSELAEGKCPSDASATAPAMEYVGFSLLSAGIFRGGRSLEDVLKIAVKAVSSSSYVGLKEVHLVAFMQHEQDALLCCLEAMELPAQPQPDNDVKAAAQDKADDQHSNYQQVHVQGGQKEQQKRYKQKRNNRKEHQNHNRKEASLVVRARKRRHPAAADGPGHETRRQRRRDRAYGHPTFGSDETTKASMWIGWGWSGAPLACRALGPCWGRC